MKFLTVKQFSFFILLAMLITSCSKSTDGITPAGGNPGGTPSGGGNGTPAFKVNVTTIAGKLGDHGNAEDGQGGAARFWNPTKMVFDNRNNTLYVADGNTIRAIDQQNNASTYMPLGTISRFSEIFDIDLAPGAMGGTLYFTTKENDLIKIEPAGNTFTITKIIDRIYGGNEIGAVNAADELDLPYGVASGANGEIYFFNEPWNTLHRIKLSSATTGTVEPFAGKALTTRGGNGNPYPYQDGQGEAATFSGRVADIASDSKGNIYVADFDNELVRKVSPTGAVSSLFPFKNRIGYDVDGPIANAQSNSVTQVTASSDGSNIFFTTYGNAANNLSALRLVRPGKDVSTLVGYGYSNYYGDGPGKTAGLAQIGGIAATPDGKTIYVSEPGNKVIRKVTIE